MGIAPKLRSWLVLLLLALLPLPLVAVAGGPAVYVVYNSSAELTALDPVTWTETSSVTMTLAGRTVVNATGMARHPLTGDLYVLLGLNGQGPRELVTVNPQTGAATDIGPADDGSGLLKFADIAFAADGSLYGVTGSGSGGSSQSLYQLDAGNGHAIFLAQLTAGDWGGASLAPLPAALPTISIWRLR
ncbi:MAG: hypothetical protein ACR2IF_05665 [Terriglobales bacterium]